MRRNLCKAPYRVPADPKRAEPVTLTDGLEKCPETVPKYLSLKRPFLCLFVIWDHEPLRPKSTGEAGAGPALTGPQSGEHRTGGWRQHPWVRMEAKSCEAQAHMPGSQRLEAGALPRRKLGQGALAPRVPVTGDLAGAVGPSGFVSSGRFPDPPAHIISTRRRQMWRSKSLSEEEIIERMSGNR